ncbi:MAG TPA: hypothetical protein VF677_10610, partial [Flavobacterium sp.]
RFGATTSELWTVKDANNPKMQVSFLYFDNNSHFNNKYYSSVSYRRGENDTIICINDDFKYLKEGHGYKENGVLWFPEYMVKVDQINYNKFYKSVRHMNLKNPRKIKN